MFQTRFWVSFELAPQPKPTQTGCQHWHSAARKSSHLLSELLRYLLASFCLLRASEVVAFVYFQGFRFKRLKISFPWPCPSSSSQALQTVNWDLWGTPKVCREWEPLPDPNWLHLSYLKWGTRELPIQLQYFKDLFLHKVLFCICSHCLLLSPPKTSKYPNDILEPSLKREALPTSTCWVHLVKHKDQQQPFPQ